MSGRCVLVTGGASGIGWSVCRRFAENGDRVVVADIDGHAAEARATELGEGAMGLFCDVAAPGAARAAVAASIKRFGRLDVLVNNAGIIDSVGMPAVDTSVEAFRRLITVNLGAVEAMAQEAKTAMGRQGGVIVNIASAGGIVASPLRTAYGSSKAGVMTLTQVLAQAWAMESIRVIAVAPGYIRTPMIEDLIASGKVDPSRIESRVPLGRMGRPEEIAEVVFYSASPEAAALSGHTIVADGGFLAVGGAGGPFGASPSAPTAAKPRTAVITGADSQPGAAVAAALLTAGNQVMLFGQDEAALSATAGQLGDRCLWTVGEPTDEAALTMAADVATAAWGRVDILVTVPVVSRGAGEAAEAFARAVDDVLTAAFVASKVVGGAILRAGGGSVVHIAPIQALQTSVADETAGGAVVMLARSLAVEWAGQGVRVNVITANLGGGRASPHSVDWLSKLVGPVCFLASDSASYVTGAKLSVLL